ncbi:hypothetical protein BDW66DRAFT_130124 [Aspergillus desertorum]
MKSISAHVYQWHVSIPTFISLASSISSRKRTPPESAISMASWVSDIPAVSSGLPSLIFPLLILVLFVFLLVHAYYCAYT